MKEQYKNSRLPHLLMIVVHGETLWSPDLQPMDDDDNDDDDDDDDASGSNGHVNWQTYTQSRRMSWGWTLGHFK